MEFVQIVILIFSAFALSRVFINIKDKNLKKLESFFWILFWIAIILGTLLPNVIEIISRSLGVQRAADLGIYAIIILLAYLVFRLYAKLENTEKKITKIVRTIAIKNENNLHK
ncbi:DUF2304 domain-containing protein [Candidatus Woesearchaeota archaeon]|nr:DUF2304 domain-containing protein [Candidatus Woesearchaeota archaeon]